MMKKSLNDQERTYVPIKNEKSESEKVQDEIAEYESEVEDGEVSTDDEDMQWMHMHMGQCQLLPLFSSEAFPDMGEVYCRVL